MRRVGVVEARQKLRALLDEVAAGEEIIVLRRGREVARLVPPPARRATRRLPTLAAFRRSITLTGRPMSRVVIAARRDARY